MDLTAVLVHPVPVLLLACVLVFLAVYFAVRWNRIISSATAPLDHAAAELEQTHGLGEMVGNVSVRLYPVLSWRQAWERYQKMLQTVDRGDGTKVLACELAPKDFFYSGVLYQDQPMHWLRGLPNYLIGLGLCFTFVGIVLVILHAANSIGTAADPTTQSDALRQLLHAASFKFITSLSGVFCSMAYSVFFRAKCAELERSLNRFCHAVSARIFLLTPAALLQMNLQQTRRQTASIGSLAANIAIGVGEKLAEVSEGQNRAMHRLEGCIGAAAQQASENAGLIVTAIRDLRERVCQVNDETMGRLVESTLKSLDSAMESCLSRIGATLDGVGRQLEETRKQFEDLTGEVEALKENYRELGDEVRTRAEEISDLLLKAEAEVEDRMQQAAAGAESVRDSFAEVFEGAAPLKELSDGISATAAQMRNAVVEWSAFTQSLTEAAKTTGAASNATRAATESLQENWRTQSQRIGEIDTHLAATIAAVQTHFDAYALRLRDFTAELDGQMAKAVNAFAQTVEGFSDAPDRFGAAATQLHQVTADAAEALEPLCELKALSSAMSDASKTLIAAVNVAQQSAPAPMPVSLDRIAP